LDKGYRVAQNFILTRIINIHIDMDEVETKEVDFKSKLIEWAQKEKTSFSFDTIQDAATSNDKMFLIHLVIQNEVMGVSQHFSKKRAEQMAAEQACIKLEIQF
ncbi:MAG: ribonuclease III, partial [Bacteroidia bacterium]|nr:ribonuclease III [Bacteroidia bacterium]